jgi:hypothetical protein
MQQNGYADLYFLFSSIVWIRHAGEHRGKNSACIQELQAASWYAENMTNLYLVGGKAMSLVRAMVAPEGGSEIQIRFCWAMVLLRQG